MIFVCLPAFFELYINFTISFPPCRAKIVYTKSAEIEFNSKHRCRSNRNGDEFWGWKLIRFIIGSFSLGSGLAFTIYPPLTKITSLGKSTELILVCNRIDNWQDKQKSGVTTQPASVIDSL